jgi:hypothetical protein
MPLQVILASESRFRTLTPTDGADRTGLWMADTLLVVFRMSGGNVSPHVSRSSSKMGAGVNWASDGWIVDSPMSTE